MSKSKRGWLAVVTALAVGASGVAWADDSGGDNGMNPMYGDSYAALEGQGHNAGAPRMQPQGAFAAHGMDSQAATPLIDRMRQTQATMAEQARQNWDAMVEKTHAMTSRMRTAMNTQGSTDQTPSAAGTRGSSTTSAAPRAPASAPSAPTGLTGSTSAPSPAGSVVSSPAANIGEPMVRMPTQSATASGYKIAPVNPRGQGPTISGPSGG